MQRRVAAPEPPPGAEGTGRAGPLHGIVVADLSTVLAGPYCTMLLGDLGATVVKVEPPEGDATRGYGPPYAGVASPEREYPGESAYFLSVNRNKLGIRVDLRHAAGREVLRRLLGRSDLLVENFRVGGLARLGFSDDELGRINPALVHLAITGYGPDGPAADRPGYDFVIQAVAGLMSITGQPDERGGQPTKVGVAITDIATGMLGAVALLAALVERGAPQRNGAPRAGQRIDISVFESTLSSLANQAASYLVAGTVPGRMGNEHPNITPYETFPTLDNEIAVAVGSERQWGRFCLALERSELCDDPRFATNAARVRHRAELRSLLEARFRERSSSDWLERLDRAHVPAARINDLASAFADPQVEARRMVESLPHPTIGDLRTTGVPFKFGRTPASIRSAPPLLGQHTDEVLRWLGYDPDAIAALRRAGTV